MDQEWTWTGSGSGPELDNILSELSGCFASLLDLYGEISNCQKKWCLLNMIFSTISTTRRKEINEKYDYLQI